MRPTLPPGPREPAIFQTVGFWARPIASQEAARARYGKRFTRRFVGIPPFIVHSEPEHIKEIFAAPPDVLHPGEGARILEPIVGSHSVILLDEDPHLEQRKLMLPAFHGERMEALAGVMTDVAERELERWPREEPVVAHPRLQSLTLEIILRAVFGVGAGPRLDELRGLLTDVLEFSAHPASVFPPFRRSLFGRGPWARFLRLRERVDEIVFELIGERRRDAGGDDVLAMFLTARHDDDSPMTDQELRDELMTMLVAGHETTASELAWALAALARAPRVQDELIAEIDAGGGDEYLTATVNETLRRRPVLPNAEPRLVKRPVEIGGWEYPPDVCLIANAYLLHHDPDVYPDPYAFRPERFLGTKPGTYTWIPFGGGRRRCIGASMATLEMKIVLRAILGRCRIEPAAYGPELTRRRSITISPKRGARTVLRTRAPGRQNEPAAAIARA